MQVRETPPFAPVLMESTRAIGYSLEAAIADIIDNSVAAKAGKVQLSFFPVGDAYVSILDNGTGMDDAQMNIAMQYGSKSPTEARDASDLGRYGLGLKTASLSQCRVLTVISKQGDQVIGRRWDLDYVIKTGAWSLLILDKEDFASVPHISDLYEQDSGTLVVWQNLDRLLMGEVDYEKSLGRKMDEVRQHLELVFHRYLSGESGIKKLEILFNGVKLKAADPFLIKKSTQAMDTETLVIRGKRILVTPYILPHISKMTEEEKNQLGGKDGIRKRQGFYVYRNKRLLIWGTWFRMMRQGDLSKLARVMVDIPNDLDDLWTLDIKKSHAIPPAEVRNSLQTVIDRIADKSKRTWTFRGKKETSDSVEHKYGSQLLEGNVRSFLSTKVAVNKKIRETILKCPSMFFAYNNGVSATAMDVQLERTAGGTHIVGARDFQIINGGQTTASLSNTRHKDKADLEGIYVQMKLTEIDESDMDRSTELVRNISRSSNSQNKVTDADFFSTHPFHIRMEQHSRRIFAPAESGAQYETKWFYERAKGQFLQAQMRLTPAKKRQFLLQNPKSKVITKTDFAKVRNTWSEMISEEFSTTDLQKNAWRKEIQILQDQLRLVENGDIAFEYTIPRMGHRIDVVCIIRGLIFLLEFKVGDSEYRKSTADQVMDYALDLKYFHELSTDRYIIPISVPTEAPAISNKVEFMEDKISKVLKCTKSNIALTINSVLDSVWDKELSIEDWINSIYTPTPTIIEAAQAMYRNHSVKDISRNDAGAHNLTATTETINRIIDDCKRRKKKAICFVTGVPGAGKTLAGLNIANERHNFDADEHAVFLSGNGPLVDVLQAALAQDRSSRTGITIAAAKKRNESIYSDYSSL